MEQLMGLEDTVDYVHTPRIFTLEMAVCLSPLDLVVAVMGTLTALPTRLEAVTVMVY